jgi:predicted XRE-type DNA-binding protein
MDYPSKVDRKIRLKLVQEAKDQEALVTTLVGRLSKEYVHRKAITPSDWSGSDVAPGNGEWVAVYDANATTNKMGFTSMDDEPVANTIAFRTTEGTLKAVDAYDDDDLVTLKQLKQTAQDISDTIPEIPDFGEMYTPSSLVSSLPTQLGTDGQVLKMSGDTVVWGQDNDTNTNTTYPLLSASEVTAGSDAGEKVVNASSFRDLVQAAIDKFPAGSFISNAQLLDAIKDLATKQQVASATTGFATTVQLTDAVKDFVTSTQLTNSISDFVTTATLFNATKDFVNKTALDGAVNNLATKSQLTAAVSGLVTTDQLTTVTSGLVTNNQLTNAISSFVNTTQLNNAIAGFVTNSQMTSAISTAVAGLVSTSQLNTAIANFITSSQLSSAIANFITSAQLTQAMSGLATQAQLTTAIAGAIPRAAGSNTPNYINRALNIPVTRPLIGLGTTAVSAAVPGVILGDTVIARPSNGSTLPSGIVISHANVTATNTVSVVFGGLLTLGIVAGTTNMDFLIVGVR